MRLDRPPLTSHCISRTIGGMTGRYAAVVIARHTVRTSDVVSCSPARSGGRNHPSSRPEGVPVANSMTDLNLWFYFRQETPAEVLSAFAPMYRPNPPDASWEPAPPLVPFS